MTIALAEATAENTRAALEAALHRLQQPGEDSFIWVRDWTDSSVIYEKNRQLWRSSYTLDDDEIVATLGEAEKVVAQTQYKTIETVQAIHDQIVREMVVRDPGSDSSRAYETLQILQGHLDKEEPIEEALEVAIEEARITLTWLREQTLTKSEGGHKFPAAAFAYVPNANRPATWSVRLWADPENKVTKSQLGRAAAALSPGGNNGSKTSIPGNKVAGVKRSVRSAYRKLGVEDTDIPKWVKETEHRAALLQYTPLTEAVKIDKGIARVVVIEPGFNVSKETFYPEEVLKRDFAVFEGAKMYADHPTDEEDEQRPERSIRDWVATLTNVAVDESGVVTGDATVIEPWLQNKLANLRDKDMLSEMGISINAVGTASKGTIDGIDTNVVEKFITARSVDFVTEPGAGGVVTLYEADRKLDIDLAELSTLRERRPDLVTEIEDGIRVTMLREGERTVDNEARIAELEKEVENRTSERDTALASVESGAKATRVAETGTAVGKALSEAELPEASKTRLAARFEGVESTEGLETAIEDERSYVASIRESSRVTNLGNREKSTPEEAEASKVSLTESFKRLNPDWPEEQVATAVRGR